MPQPRKPTLCLDFDGVLHSYTSPWAGAHVVSDPPTPGAVQFLVEAVEHFDVCVYSSRTGEPNGVYAMMTWLAAHASAELGGDAASELMSKIRWPTTKPPAFVTLDDRAVTFVGVWPGVDVLKNFKPWNKP